MMNWLVAAVLAALGVGDAALDGADGVAGFVVVEADALGAQVGVDDVHRLAFAYCLVGALWLTGATVDAFLRDGRCHIYSLLKSLLCVVRATLRGERAEGQIESNL